MNRNERARQEQRVPRVPGREGAQVRVNQRIQRDVR